ncbi:hypothetical protein LCGC14_0711050 [marine sediment metagenome]|uniref:Uncharacterized protein n=1 Tax=marine sediment metagenome TaxID=412755 RepID=A0A0F9TMJ4_9ZZZZ
MPFFGLLLVAVMVVLLLAEVMPKAINAFLVLLLLGMLLQNYEPFVDLIDKVTNVAE